MRSRPRIATRGNGRSGEEGAARRRSRALRVVVGAAVSIVALGRFGTSLAGNPLSVIGETFSDWKDRLFGHSHRVAEAPEDGAVPLDPGHRIRIHIDDKAGERDFPKGKSRFRVVDLSAPVPHAAIRLEIAALPRNGAFGNEVFKPYLYTLNDDDSVRDTIEVKPHLDIRPFRRTRLLACATVDDIERFAIATSPDIVGKSYESEVRDAVKAPTQGGFYYATDAVKVKLPYAATGELILEVTKEDEKGKGC